MDGTAGHFRAEEAGIGESGGGILPGLEDIAGGAIDHRADQVGFSVDVLDDGVSQGSGERQPGGAVRDHPEFALQQVVGGDRFVVDADGLVDFGDQLIDRGRVEDHITDAEDGAGLPRKGG